MTTPEQLEKAIADLEYHYKLSIDGGHKNTIFGTKEAGIILSAAKQHLESLNNGGANLNVYTCTGFTGHWPVGTAAIVIAATPEEAQLLLDKALSESTLPPTTSIDTYKVVDTAKPHAIILNDGDH